MEKQNRYTLINRSVAISANINLLLNQICNLWEWNGINHRLLPFSICMLIPSYLKRTMFY